MSPFDAVDGSSTGTRAPRRWALPVDPAIRITHLVPLHSQMRVIDWAVIPVSAEAQLIDFYCFLFLTKFCSPVKYFTGRRSGRGL